MRSENNFLGATLGGFGGCIMGEPLPLPEVIEEDSDACWALWEELNRAPPQPAARESLEAQWARTQTDDIAAGAPAARAAAGSLTVEAVFAIARQNNRVCPNPAQWMMLYDVLTLGGKRVLKPYPPAPVSGRSWDGTSAMSKRIRMRDQIIWAADYGGLSSIHAFLSSLAEDEWHHFGE